MVNRTLSVMAVLAAWAAPALAQQAANGDAGRGRQLFMADGCYECHGTVGQGGVGFQLAPSVLPSLAIAAYIRNPAGEMPPYSSKLVSDADVRDIHAYLLSIPASPDWQSIPELRRTAEK